MIGTQKKLGALLSLVSRAHYNLANQVFERVGLFRAQPPVLFALGQKDGITQSELAEYLEISTPTLTNLLRRMEAAGLISRVHDPADARVSRVYLTATGKTVLAQAYILGAEMDEVAFAGFSSEERERLNEFLKRIHTNLTSVQPVVPEIA